MELPPIGPTPPRPPLASQEIGAAPAAERAARETAQAFETAFLADMLKYSGVNQTPDSTGGGAGEDAFASFLTQEYARMISERGGIGLAEQIFNAIHQKGPGS